MAHAILIIGAGHVGRALGAAWSAIGHDVRYGVPEPANQKYSDLPPASVHVSTERRGARVIVLAVPFAAAAAAVEALGDLSGAIIIDCTNPLSMTPHGLQLTVGHDTSGAEQIAPSAPGVPFFKALNQTGAENIANARAYHPRPVMFVAGDDQQNKPTIMELVGELGFEAVDAGPLSAARLLEPLAMLWIELAMKRGHAREFAFSMVRHPRSTGAAQ